MLVWKLLRNQKISGNYISLDFDSISDNIICRGDDMKNNNQRQRFFSTQVNMPVWKENLTGNNEEFIKECLDALGYRIDIDYERQYPVLDRYVLDFAFIEEKIAIEIDGAYHRIKRNIVKDEIRDKKLRANDWVVLRIPEKKFKENGTYWKYLIYEVVTERRKTLFH